MLKDSGEIEKLADEIADMIISTRQLAAQKTETKIAEGQELDRKLTERLLAIENRVSKLANNLKSAVIEFELRLSERLEEANRENDEARVSMQGEIETLRSALIRLKNELRERQESKH